jgi:hypothetical protein
MKKIKIVLLILVMALLFAACVTDQTGTETEETGYEDAQTGDDGSSDTSEGDGTTAPPVREPLSDEARTAYEIYLLASDSLDGAESFIMDTSSVMNMNMDGENMEMLMDALIKMVVISETEVDIYMEALTKTDEMEIPMTTYFRDGVMYMDMQMLGMGMKVKMEMPLEEMLAQLESNGALDFPEEAIIDASITETDNGTIISFTLSGSFMNDMMDSITGGMFEMMGLDTAAMSLNIGDVGYIAVLDSDNMLVTMDMTMSMEMEINGVPSNMDMTTSMTIVQIGGVEIDFPADLDEYMDYGEYMTMLMGGMF